jgi:hypothetical protein
MGTQAFPEVVMPECLIQQHLKGHKALVTGASPGMDGGMTLHMSAEDAEYLAAGDYSVRCLGYDWSLNERRVTK